MTLKANGYYNSQTNTTTIAIRDTDPDVSVSFDAKVNGQVFEVDLVKKGLEWFINKYIQEYAAQKLDEKVEKAIDKLTQVEAIATTLVKATDLPEEAKKEIASHYPFWEAGKSYAAKDIVNYKDVLYEVIQAHRSQSDWLPDAVASLYKPLINATGTIEQVDGTSAEIVVIDEFKQPTGAHDAYKKGDKVTFDGKVYESLADTNVYSPSDYPVNWREVI